LEKFLRGTGLQTQVLELVSVTLRGTLCFDNARTLKS
jgi:hypothetical protein